MRCRDARRLISERLDGSLGPREERDLEEHLAACEQCRQHVRQMQRVQLAFSARAFAQPGPDFAAGVMGRLRAQRAAAARPVRHTGWTSRFDLGLGPSWVGLALLAAWLWVSGLILIGTLIFSLLGGWSWLADTWVGTYVGGFFQGIADALVGFALALWSAVEAGGYDVSLPLLLGAAIVAIAFCFGWYRLLRQYRWQTG